MAWVSIFLVFVEDTDVAQPEILISGIQFDLFQKSGDIPALPVKWLEERMLLATESGCILGLFSVIPITDQLKPKRNRAKTMFGGGYL